MMADLSSFTAFVESSDNKMTSRAWNKALTIDHTGFCAWRSGPFEFETPGNDRNAVLAAWYALYLKACEKGGVEPGPFESDADEDEWHPERG